MSQKSKIKYLESCRARKRLGRSLWLSGKRGKLSPYEMGIRTPMFVRWPKTVKPQRDDETLATILDFPTTILKLAGAKARRIFPASISSTAKR